MNAPDVALEASVIVPSYRGANRLPTLLDALADQEKDGVDFEVVVVIDGIDDGSVALIEAEERFPLRHILFPENRGRVAALNAGFAAAKGRVLIRCDDDLVVPLRYVAAHVAAHRDAAQVAVVGPTRDIHTPSAYSRAYGEDAAARSLHHALTRPPEEQWRLWAASCSITKATWDEIGPYDSRYQGYGWEDVDYGYRLHAAGVPVRVLEEALAEHHGPARTARDRALKAFDAGRARETFRRIHPEAPIAEQTPGTGLWGFAVRSASGAFTSRGAAERWAARMDRLLPVMPSPVGRKLVALAVEGAGIAGSRAASRQGGAR